MKTQSTFILEPAYSQTGELVQGLLLETSGSQIKESISDENRMYTMPRSLLVRIDPGHEQNTGPLDMFS